VRTVTLDASNLLHRQIALLFRVVVLEKGGQFFFVTASEEVSLLSSLDLKLEGSLMDFRAALDTGIEFEWEDDPEDPFEDPDENYVLGTVVSVFSESERVQMSHELEEVYKDQVRVADSYLELACGLEIRHE
jgi:hypothetical protein